MKNSFGIFWGFLGKRLFLFSANPLTWRLSCLKPTWSLRIYEDCLSFYSIFFKVFSPLFSSAFRYGVPFLEAAQKCPQSCSFKKPKSWLNSCHSCRHFWEQNSIVFLISATKNKTAGKKSKASDRENFFGFKLTRPKSGINIVFCH